MLKVSHEPSKLNGARRDGITRVYLSIWLSQRRLTVDFQYRLRFKVTQLKKRAS